MNFGRNGLGVVAVLALSTLAGCGTKLATETEKVDLSSSGLAVTLTAPKGATQVKERTGASLEWGSHAEAGRLSLALRKGELGCTPQDEDCKVLEQTPTSAIKQYTFIKHTMFAGRANVDASGTNIACDASAKNADDVRRLLTACQSLTATGPLTSTTTVTSATTPAAAKAPAAPALVDETTTASDRQGPFVYTVRLPAGHTTLETGSGRTFGSPKGTSFQSQVSVSVFPYMAINSLAAAEKDAKAMDIGGLDSIADKRELSKTSFLVETAPRGTGGFMTVYVYAKGKKRYARGRCWGPATLRASLEEMCTSLKVD